MTAIMLTAFLASNVLVYGPTNFVESDMLEEQGHTVTIWGEDQWAAATQEEFALFDLIVVGDQSCSGPGEHDEFCTLLDTRELWGPTITGRVAALSLDPACHSADWEGAEDADPDAPARFFENVVSWLTEGGAVAAYFSTDWGRIEADHLAVFGDFLDEQMRGELISYTDSEHPIFNGLEPDSLNGWGASFHSPFLEYPDDFEVLALGTPEDTVKPPLETRVGSQWLTSDEESYPVILLREAIEEEVNPVANLPENIWCDDDDPGPSPGPTPGEDSPEDDDVPPGCGCEGEGQGGNASLLLSFPLLALLIRRKRRPQPVQKLRMERPHPTATDALPTTNGSPGCAIPRR